MTLKQLRYLIEVCQQNNMTKAASILHVAQPSISVAIKELEQELGISIFHRINHQLSLTEEGLYFYNKLKIILDELDSLVCEVKDLGLKKNPIKIGIPPMMGSFIFPKIFSQLKLINPKIQFEITEGGALDVQQMLQDEILDLALFISESMQCNDILFKPILQSSFKIVVHPTNPLTNNKILKLKDLNNEPLVLFGQGFYLHRIIMDYFATHSIKPNVVLETDQINTIKRFVSEGIASTILIDESVFEDEDLVKIPVDDLPEITIAIAWKKNRLLNKDALEIIEHDLF